MSFVMVLAVPVAVAGIGTATAQSDQPTLRVTEGTPTDGGNTSVDIVLTAAPEGLSGYYLDVGVESPDDARIVDASYPDQFGLTTDPDYQGDRVTLEAADLDGAIEAGATDVRLATVVVSATDPELSVDPRQFDADDGGSIDPVQQQSTPGSAGDDGQAASDETGAVTETSDGSGPLPAVFVLVAAALVAGLGSRRQRGR